MKKGACPLLPVGIPRRNDDSLESAWLQRATIEMIGSAVREIVAAADVPLICAAFNEEVVQVWNVETRNREGELLVPFKIGSRSLAIHPAGALIATCFSAKRGTVSGYAVPDGKRVWIRDQIKDGAYVGFDHSGKTLSFTSTGQTVERVDPNSGITIEVLNDTRRYIEGPGGRVFIAPSFGESYVIRNERDVRIPQLTFAVLDVAFDSHGVCLTESGGPVRCIEYDSGRERWLYTPPAGSHVLKLHYSPCEPCFYGILWHYKSGEFRYLMRFDASTGKSERVCRLNSWSEAFSQPTQQLVTSGGQLIGLRDGEIAGALSFPTREYL